MEKDSDEVLILGGGLGGLLCAALLAREGMAVRVLEKNKQIGGCLQSYALDGHLVESAVHYVGSLSPGQSMHTLLTYLGVLPEWKIAQLDTACFDEIILADRSYPLAQGDQDFIESLGTCFPHARRQLQQYVAELNRVCAHFPMYHLNAGDPHHKEAVLPAGLQQTMDHIIQDEQLKRVLTGNHLLYAGSYSTNPFYQHALIQSSFMEGAYKSRQGGAGLARILTKVIQAAGGVVQRNTAVCKLRESDGKLLYAEDQEGRQYYARQFISTLHPRQTMQILDSDLIRPAMRARLKDMKQTVSCFLLNIALHPGKVPYINHNKYYHPEGSNWLTDECGYSKPVYGIYFSEDHQMPGFTQCISVLTYLPYEKVMPWANSFKTHHEGCREEAYETFKQEYAEKIMQELSPIIPGLKAAVKQINTATPLTYRDYLGSPEGSLYGIQKSIYTQMQTTLGIRTRIPNLLFSGQAINLHGVLGVAITAVMTAATWTGLDELTKKIKSEVGI